MLGNITLWRDECENDNCFGKQGVLRISMSLFLFFIVMSIAMIGHKKHEEESMRTQIQDGYWIIKILLLIAITVAVYLLPNQVMVYYGYSSMVGAVFFIFLQILLLVDFAYDWNDKWVAKERYRSIIACSVVIYLAALTGIVLQYVFFGHSSDCGLNIFLTSFCAFLSIVATLISLRDDIQRGALLTSAVVTGFCTYLVFSAMLNSTSQQCNPFPPGASTRVWLLAIGVVIAIASICWNTISSASQRGVLQLSVNKDEEASLLAHEEECYNFSYFHLVFACGAMYMGMLFTGWNLSSAVSTGQFDIGPVDMWMKIASSWVAALLYIWSMVGPSLMPNREWN